MITKEQYDFFMSADAIGMELKGGFRNDWYLYGMRWGIGGFDAGFEMSIKVPVHLNDFFTKSGTRLSIKIKTRLKNFTGRRLKKFICLNNSKK